MEKYIAFEGLDDQRVRRCIDLFAAWLTERGESARLTDEYADSPFGVALFGIDATRGLPAEAYVRVLEALRMEHYVKIVAPELAKGKWVLVRRYSQGSLRHRIGVRVTDNPQAPSVIFYASSRPETLWRDNRDKSVCAASQLSLIEALCAQYEKADWHGGSVFVRIDVDDDSEQILARLVSAVTAWAPAPKKTNVISLFDVSEFKKIGKSPRAKAEKSPRLRGSVAVIRAEARRGHSFAILPHNYFNTRA
jgi:thymidylate kinase